MALIAGTQIGPYQIIDQIGSGGMGEVYRATDTKLGRDVAIKTLPSALAQEPDRLARFEREAKLLATLSHAHIGAIYGLDEYEGTQFIAMELVEGQTLEEKLKDGALPTEDALRIALQIAEALEAAHEKGVVHRDLKPANIMLTTDGIVKVLDFGLAKAFSGDPNAASPAHSPALSMAMTQQGLILGTAGYMSPEQASGQATDQRADIWAFGVVLYEMLTGLPLFSGESVPHILADVLRTEPDWSRLPKRLHPRVRLLIERCLKKKVRDRYHSVADVRVDIEDALKDPEGIAAAAAMAQLPQSAWRRVSPIATAGLATGLIVAAGFLVFDQYFAASEAPSEPVVTTAVSSAHPVRRGPIDLGPTTPISNTLMNAHIALSRDGTRLAYAIDVGEATQLFVRDLGQLEARALPGTEGAQHPFFSPDGEWVAFFADETDSKLKRIPFRGGPPQTLADIEGAGGGFWGEDGRIVYSTNPGNIRSILRIPATGGTPERLIEAEPDVGGHQWPAPLPGGEAILFVVRPGFGGNGAIQDGRIAVLSLASHEYRVLIEGAHRPQYVPTGHIAFVRAGSLWAVPFDPERLEIMGPEVPVVDDVQQNGQIGGSAFAFADDGLLTYLPGSDVSDAETGAFPKDLVWVNRDGREEPLGFESRAYWAPQISPDGLKLATDIGPGSNVWINDLERGTSSRLTFSPGTHETPHWMPDGERIIFWSARANEQGGLFWQAANGTGQPERLTTSGASQFPTAADADRGELIYTDTSTGSDDIHVLSLQGEHDSRPLLTAPFNERSASISPDGRWMAYESDETGIREVFVRPYPNVDDGRWQISNEGGTDPHWGLDGSELFFIDGEAMMVVRVEAGDTFLPRTPEALFIGNYWSLFATVPNYDLAPDGRFLMMRGAQGTTEVTARTLLVTVENWFDELKRLAPAKGSP